MDNNEQNKNQNEYEMIKKLSGYIRIQLNNNSFISLSKPVWGKKEDSDKKKLNES